MGAEIAIERYRAPVSAEDYAKAWDTDVAVKYLADHLASSFLGAVFGQSPEERGREIVRSIDKMVAPYGGSAVFDRVEGVTLHYTLSMPSDVAELWRTSAVAMGVYQ